MVDKMQNKRDTKLDFTKLPDLLNVTIKASTRDLINITKELNCHGYCSAQKISQGMLKNVFYLVRYYKRLKTNAQNSKHKLYFDECQHGVKCYT